MTDRHPKAIVMLSGGLDSTLAAKIVQDQGVELHGLHLALPWGCCDRGKAQSSAALLGIPFTILKVKREFLDVVRQPKYGYGREMNPCVDCRSYMLKLAGKFMPLVNADFVVTGEVVGQRPNSQLKRSMRIIERESGLEGRLLRPLSARYLAPTEAEQRGWVDRSNLFNLTGRSRKRQIGLAAKLGIDEQPAPSGGCLLTEKPFGSRVRDLFQNQSEIDLEDLELLRLGRHFRISPNTKIVVGRNETENQMLRSLNLNSAVTLATVAFPGPVSVIVGEISERSIGTAVRIIVYYAKPQRLGLDSIALKLNEETLLNFVLKELEPLSVEELDTWRLAILDLPRTGPSSYQACRAV
ncbi:MAG: hypothetical protein JW937_07165 [Candidatus Omnitrophica bacterium]|nr:hypothetical protein [Candidatus Omnitrophota bacterium]